MAALRYEQLNLIDFKRFSYFSKEKYLDLIAIAD
jgi:hypothetical protein